MKTLKLNALSIDTTMSIYDVQIEGEVFTLKTPAPVLQTWQHGPCITILTRRGYVEYNQMDQVKAVVK